MSTRQALLERRTRETDIQIHVDLDGKGDVCVDTPIGFLSHMLEALGRHSLIDLQIKVSGDLHVDQHHTIEDTGFVLGGAIAQALQERRGIARVGWCRHPMDEALADVAIDLSGRPCLVYHAEFNEKHVGTLQLDLLYDFFEAFCRALGANLHIDLVRGRSDHHKVEAIFKACARALKMAVAHDPRLGDQIPSSKGTLDLPATSNQGGTK